MASRPIVVDGECTGIQPSGIEMQGGRLRPSPLGNKELKLDERMGERWRAGRPDPSRAEIIGLLWHFAEPIREASVCHDESHVAQVTDRCNRGAPLAHEFGHATSFGGLGLTRFPSSY